MDQATILAYASVLGTAVTAIATIFLWLVTKTLATETKRMVEAGSKPHVVATIEPSRWSMMHSELTVTNTGNATAYNINVEFIPEVPIDRNDMRKRKLPLQNISVLKPSQGMASYLGEFGPLIEKEFTVKIGWNRDASSGLREFNEYTLNMSHLEGIVRLGSADPVVQIAEDIRKIRDDWKGVAGGSRRLSADVFTADDRDREREQLEEHWHRAERQEQEQEQERLAQQSEPSD